jgi:hypothetical protein
VETHRHGHTGRPPPSRSGRSATPGAGDRVRIPSPLTDAGELDHPPPRAGLVASTSTRNVITARPSDRAAVDRIRGVRRDPGTTCHQDHDTRGSKPRECPQNAGLTYVPLGADPPSGNTRRDTAPGWCPRPAAGRLRLPEPQRSRPGIDSSSVTVSRGGLSRSKPPEWRGMDGFGVVAESRNDSPTQVGRPDESF